MTHSWTKKGLKEVNTIAKEHSVSFKVAEKLLFYFIDKEYVDRAIQNKFPFARKIEGVGKETEKQLHGLMNTAHF